MGLGTTSDRKSGLPSLFRVLSPLLFLLIPLVVLILARFLIADYSDIAAFWTSISAYAIGGIIIVWVLIRSAFYLRIFFTVRRHHAEMQRNDPLFIVEMKMQERLKRIHEKLKLAGTGVYDVPFYVVVTDPDAEVDAFLNGSGITFPKELNDAELDVTEEFEKWYVGTQAVFVDVSQLMSPSMQNEWLLFLKTLVNGRWNAPINGALVVFSREHLVQGESEQRTGLELAIQKNLQLMQEKLKEKFPAYLAVTHVDEIDGFNEFFGDLRTSSKAQMFGWSNPDPLATPLDLSRFGVELNRMIGRMRSYLLERMTALQDADSVDLAYGFVEKISELNSEVKQSVSRIFNPQNYLDPVPLRGAYLTGGGYTGNSTSTIGANATFMGDGPDLSVAGGTVVGVGRNVKDLLRNQNWFVGDFVSSKLLSESGNIARPVWVLKKQKRILIVGIAALVAQLILSVFFMVNEVMATSDWREQSDKVLANAREILERPIYEKRKKQDIADAENILVELSRLESVLQDEKLFQGSSSLGRRGELLSGLQTIHRAIFYKYFVRELIQDVEQELSSWQPDKKPFAELAPKLIEYIKWANPHYDGPLQISPFYKAGSTVELIKQRQFLEQNFSYDADAEKTELADDVAAQRIIKFFKQLNGPTRITLPLQAGEKYRSPGESEWEWWQRVSGSIDYILKHMGETIEVNPELSENFKGDPGNQIYELVQAVKKMMSEVEALEKLADEGEEKFSYWTSSVEDFFELSKKSAVHWSVVEDEISKSEARDKYAVKKIVIPIFDNRMHLIQLFNELSTGQLHEFLSGFAEKRAGISPQEAKIYQDIGSRVMRLHKTFGAYLNSAQTLIQKSGELVANSDYYKEEEILKKLLLMRKEAESVSTAENQLLELLDATDELVKVEDSDELVKPKSPKDLKKAAKANSKQGLDLLKNALGEEGVRLEALEKYSWKRTSTWVRTWRKLLKRERVYLISMYWMELFDWYRPIPKSNHKRTWHELMRIGPLAEGGEGVFTERIDDFLEQWATSVPSEVISAIKDDSQPHPRELKDFIDLYSQVSKFRSAYMPALRKATNMFVTTVKALNANAYENWKKLSGSDDSELSWDALESYTRFRDEYEISEGINMRNITGSLVGMEVTIRKEMGKQLSSDFTTRWKAVIQEAKNRSLVKAFPFNRTGESGDHNEVLEVLASARSLGEQYGVLRSEDASSGTELSKEAQSALDGIVSVPRRKFMERCLAFQKFLKGDDEQLPHAMIRIVSKDIGKHYHWIRMTIGRNAYFDMGVYGEKAVKVDVASNYGGVKFEGLDISKVSRGEQRVTSGDFGLLTLLYLHGKPTNQDRTTWIVSTQLGASDADGEQVSFDMEFVFNQSVPNLPIIPR